MYNVAVTAMIWKDGKILLTKRHENKKKFPGMWTFPGGNLDESDFIGTPTDIENLWYDVLEKCLKRETKEETNIEIDNIKYLCSMAVPNGIIISYIADYKSGDIVLQETECTDYVWATVDEAKLFPLVDGLDKEIDDALSLRN